MMQHRQSWHRGLMLLALCATLWGSAVSVCAQSQEAQVAEANRLEEQARQLFQGGRSDEALALLERVLAIREKAFGAEHAAVAQTLNNLSALYYQKGDYGRAEPLLQRALAIAEKALGAEHPDVAQTLSNLAELYYKKGDYGRAEPLYQRVLAIDEKALGPEHADLAIDLNSLAWLYYAKGDYGRAEPLFQRALAIREKALGAEHTSVATSLNNLALIYKVKGDYVRAEPLYQRALAIREKALGAEHADVAASLNNLGMLYYTKGDYSRAEPLYNRALAIKEKVLGAEDPSIATSLNNLAELYRLKGDYARAEPLYQRALAIREKALGAEHPDVATSLNSLAALYDTKADYGRAEPLYQRALAIDEKAMGPEHPKVATDLNNLAFLYYTKGDYGRAEPMYQRALAIKEKALGAEHPDVAMVLNNLAALYDSKGDYARSEPLYQRALAISEKALGAEHPDVAQTLNNLAELYRIKDDYGRAEPLYNRALAIREKVLGAEHPDVAQSLNNLAALYDAKGDYGRAEPLYQRALAINEKAMGPQHPEVATNLNNLVVVYEAKGDYERAITGMTRAADIREQNIALILVTGSEKQKQLYLDTISFETDGIVSLNTKDAPKSVAAARLALTTILRRKGRALDVMTDQIAVLRRRAAPEDQKLLDQLAIARSQLANLQLGGARGNLAPAARQAQLASLADEVEKLEAAISRRSSEFRALALPVTLPNVQAVLPADAALIEIFLYKPFNARPKPGEKTMGAARYVAYVARPEGEPQFADLGEATAIDASVEKLREALSPDACFAEKRKNAEDTTQCLDVEAAKHAARVVDEQVMRPVRALLGNTKSIFLSPDGALNLIPFAALVDENNKYLVESYTLTYLTSGRDLLRLQIAGESKDPPTVLANPLYNLNNTPATQALGTQTAKRDVEFRQLDFTKLLYPQLSGTAKEATALATLIPNARVWTDKQATEAALKGVSRPRILHIATHGFFLPDQPKPVANSGARQLIQQEAQAVELKNENPMLRSGLILAGVNQHSSGANEDGVLTAAEAAGLDLFGTKLVVLSACETGVGEVHNGDSVYGLRRALVLAGSESQVMSLWKVSDEGTQELMTDYYTRLQRGEGRTEALRQVELGMIHSEKRKHPYYWASFIQSGAWMSLK